MKWDVSQQEVQYDRKEKKAPEGEGIFQNSKDSKEVGEDGRIGV